MKKKDVKKFASTKHKGLPMKKEMLGKLKEMIKQELSEYTYGVGDVVKDVNPTCPHYGAMGKVKSVNPRSVVFVVMNKGKNFKPGMKLEKSHDQMKKMNESFTPYRDVGKKTQIAGGIVNHWTRILFNELPVKHRNVNGVKKALRVIQQMYMVTDHSGVTGMYRVGKRKFMKDVVKKMDKLKESVNEMSAKSKKIINKLNKKEKEMFMDMVDMLGFDQVMADYKRDKKAFKQALKDMTEGVINEKVKFKTAAEYFKNLDQSIGLIIRQANNLKGALAKHPIKQNINQLKAVQTMLKRALRPTFIKAEKERRVGLSLHGVDITELKKKLQDGKFKSAVEFSLIPALDTRSYDSNSFYFLDNYPKENKLRKRLVDVLYGLRNKMDKAQLENINEKKKMFPPDKMTPKQAKEYKKFIDYAKMGIEYKIDMSLFESINEDGHTDVASSKRKVMIMVDDSNKLLNKLNGMNKEDSLPSWWSDKITLSQNYLEKATNYLLNPVESVNEARLDPNQTLQQLGGNRFIAMTGAKNLAVDKSKNELHMKIMRNAKGISHVRIRLTSMDLYDMEFLQVRAGRIKIKSKEKGVYGDQLAKMFKKNTGLNVRL
jgi:uncharacterized protein YozE (UPF0346 family)